MVVAWARWGEPVMSMLRYLAMALTAAIAVPATNAAAQTVGSNPPVLVQNISDETRKICFHKPKRVTLFPIGCVTLKKGESINWDRKGVFTPFKVKVYQKRKLVDKYLYSRDLSGGTGKVIVGEGKRFGFSLFKNMAKDFVVRACNTQHDDPVWLSLGFDTSWGMMSQGWWELKRGECKTLPVTKSLERNWNVGRSNMPRVYYYARTYGENRKVWSKGRLAKTFCLNKGTRFKARLDGVEDCSADQEKTAFRFLSAPTSDSDTTLQLAF